ncbi:MAG: DUF805 domain-containing protein [Rhodobacteraceae bacterium]|nr:DUF805 domain-containing protein [Paracoccaceae bacterium]
MTFQQAVATCFRKYVTFEGRAPRSEYWWWVVFLLAGNLATAFLEATIIGIAGNGPPLMSSVFSLVVFLPHLAVMVRRLHDTNRSGFWFFIVFVPLVGWLILLYFLIIEGTRGPNDFGADPIGRNGHTPPPTEPDSGLKSAPSSIPKVGRKSR